MHCFTDNAGRSWTLTVTVNAIKRVRAVADHDLLEVFGGHLFRTIHTDPVVVVDILWGLCRPEAEAKGITAEQFGEALVGKELLAARVALLEELATFCPSPEEAALLRARMAAQEKLAAELLKHDMAAIEAISLEKLLISARKQSSATSGDVPGSAA